MKFILNCLFLCIIKCTLLNAYSSPANLGKFETTLNSSIQGLNWVRLCVKMHPELLWLADKNVRVTQEANASLQGAYSEQLFGNKYIEFDRTIMTLHCLRLILDGSEGSYEEFTKAQSPNEKLKEESFKDLHILASSLLKSEMLGMSELEILQAMEASLILGDIGKSERARVIFSEYGVSAPDHDDFHSELIPLLEKMPHLSPTFNSLSLAARELIFKTADLAHYGHIAHLEGGPNMFKKLKNSKIAFEDPKFLLFDFFIHICDVAGALGHVNNSSSIVYTESTYQTKKAVLEACQVLANPDKCEEDAYMAYLGQVANWLGLDIENNEDRILARVGAMLRLRRPEEGHFLKVAMQSIPNKVQLKIIDQLDVENGVEFKKTPTYIPAVLINLVNNAQLGSSKNERLTQAINLGLPFIVQALEKHKLQLLSLDADPCVPLNFNKVAGWAKKDPLALTNQFYIDPEGTVQIQAE